MASTPLTGVLRETLALFEVAGEPRTTTEVADTLDLGRRSTYERLERLVEHGRLETKKVGGNGRVWWRPPASGDVTPDWSGAAESLVDDVLDAAEVGIFVLDEEFEVAWINEATERYFGLDRERVVGRDKRRLIGEEIASVVEEGASFAETVLATYDDNTYAEQFECRLSGEERWLEHRSKPIESGAYAGGRVELYYDITDRKRVKQVHDRDRTQFESIVGAVEEYAIYMLDPDGAVRTWNRGAERLEGYAADAILGEHVSTFYTDDAQEQGVPRENLASAAEDGSVRDEGWRLRADGSRFWASVTITAVRGDDGDLDGYVKVTRDMTEQRAAEHEIQRERNLLEQVQEASPIGIAVFDTEGELRRANQRFAELLGRGGSESLEYSLGEQPPHDAEGEVIPYPERPAPRALATGEPVTDQRMRVDGPDGRTRWLSVNAKPFDGETDGVVVTTTDVTRLEAQAQRLRRQRDQLHDEIDEVFARIDDAFFALDENWRFTHVSDRAAELVRVPPEELIGALAWDILPEIAEGSPRAAAERAMETQEPFELEFYSELLEIWVEIRGYPSATGMSVYVRDITERKERERRLERFERMVETVNDGVYATDGDGEFVFVNDAFVAMSEHTREQLLGAHGSAFFGERFVDTDEPEWRELVTGERDAVTFETDIAAPDGGIRTVHNQFVALDLGDETGRVGVTRDVTERKDRERALEEHERIVETIADGIYVLDEDREFQRVNDAFTSMTSFGRSELLGAHASLVFGESFADLDAAAGRQFEADDPDVAVFEEEIYTAEGDAITVESRFARFEVEDGQGRVGVVRDVTERKRHEERLQALNSLNEVVREITSAVIDQSTREEIEATVCERLADSDSYLFAWIGDVDPASRTVNLRSEAGVEGYLDDIIISVAPDDERSDGPTGRAFHTRETQVVHDASVDPQHDPWREHVQEHGVRSSVAVPVVHEGTIYGLLNVYSERSHAFTGQEQEVIGQLGEVVGYAIAAAERKQALMSDELVELEFRIQDVFAALDVPDGTCGTVSLDHTVPVGDGEFLVYGTATPDDVDTVRALTATLPHWAELTVRSEGDPTTFELRMTDPPVLSTVASLGGYVERAVIEEGDYRMTIHLAPSVDARQINDAVEAAYPTAELLRRRQISRDRDDSRRLQRHLVDDLTERQRTALETAYHAGFFEWPRDASGEDVAASIGVAPPTFHQHLRKAERKMFDTVFSSPI